MMNSVEMDRDIAVLIYNGKIYTDTNHQYALETALNEYKESLNIDLEWDLNKAIDVTCEMRQKEELYTLDIFTYDYNEYFLVAYDEKSYYDNKEMIDTYVKEYGYKLGIFEDYQSNMFNLVS